MIVAEYTFDPNLYNLIPTFNSGFTSYTISDTVTAEGYTTRIISSDSLPTTMTFGNSDSTGTVREQSLIEVLSMDTSALTTMNNMFRNCSNLVNIKCNWNTANVTDIGDMFFYCASLKRADFQYWNTSNIVNMAGLFNGCKALEYVNLANWDISNTIYLQFMFYGCLSLKDINLENWDVRNVTSINSMFYNCDELEVLNLSGWNMDNSTVLIENLFINCNSMLSIVMKDTSVETINKIIVELPTETEAGRIELIAPGIDESELYQGNPILVLVTKYELVTYKFIEGTDMLPNFDTTVGYEYEDVNNGDGTITRTLETYDYVTHIDFSECEGLLEILFLDIRYLETFYRLFYGCSSLYYINMDSWNTSIISDMSYAFYGCSSLQSLDLRGWSTNNSISFLNMFAYCSNLLELTFGSNCNMAIGQNFQGMFDSCSKLIYLDLSMWDLSNSTNLTDCMNNCNSLVQVDLGQNTATSNKIISILPNRNNTTSGILKIEYANLTGLNIQEANSKNWLLKIRSYIGTSPMKSVYIGDERINKIIINNLIVYDINDL